MVSGGALGGTSDLIRSDNGGPTLAVYHSLRGRWNLLREHYLVVYFMTSTGRKFQLATGGVSRYYQAPLKYMYLGVKLGGVLHLFLQDSHQTKAIA